MASPSSNFQESDTECVRRSLCPSRGAFVPPDESPNASTVQQVSLWMQAEAVPSGLLGVSIPQALIWMPFRGPDAIYRSSLYQQGYQPVLLNRSTLMMQSWIKGLQLLQDVFIPVEDTRQIRWSPELSQAFEVGRDVCGYVKLKSDATSTTSTALTGTFDAGYVSDITQVMGLSPPDVSQFTLTRKDTYNSIPIQDGVVFVQGASIPKEFQRVNAITAVDADGINEQWSSVLTSQGSVPAFRRSFPNGTITATDPPFPFLSAPTVLSPNAVPNSGIFISPWWTSTNANNTNVTIPPMSVYDEPKIRIYCGTSKDTSVDGNNWTSIAVCTYRVSITHVWMYEYQDPTTGQRSVEFVTSPNGQEMHPLVFSTGVGGTGFSQQIHEWTYPGISIIRTTPILDTDNQSDLSTANQCTFIIETRALRPNFTKNSNLNLKGVPQTQNAQATNLNTMYAFSYVTFESGELDPGGAVPIPASQFFDISRVDVSVPYATPNQNAAHIAQWRKVGAGQTINVNGTFYVQAPPSKLTPYQKTVRGNTEAIRCCTADLLNFMDLLYNSDQIAPLKRIWTQDAYDQITRDVNNLSWQYLLEQVAAVENVDLRNSMLRSATKVMEAWAPFEALKSVGNTLWKGIKSVGRALPGIVETVSGVGPLLSMIEHPGLKGIGDAIHKYGPIAGELAETAATLAAAGGFCADNPYHANDFCPGGIFCQDVDAWEEGDEETLMADAYFAALAPEAARQYGYQSGNAKPALMRKPALFIAPAKSGRQVVKKLSELTGVPMGTLRDTLNILDINAGGSEFLFFPMGIDRSNLKNARAPPQALGSADDVYDFLSRASIIMDPRRTPNAYFDFGRRELMNRAERIFNQRLNKGQTPDEATAAADKYMHSGRGRAYAQDFLAKTGALFAHVPEGQRGRLTNHVPRSLNRASNDAEKLEAFIGGNWDPTPKASTSKAAIARARGRVRPREDELKQKIVNMGDGRRMLIDEDDDY